MGQRHAVLYDQLTGQRAQAEFVTYETAASARRTSDDCTPQW
jgi:hypothetical protein